MTFEIYTLLQSVFTCEERKVVDVAMRDSLAYAYRPRSRGGRFITAECNIEAKRASISALPLSLVRREGEASI